MIGALISRILPFRDWLYAGAAVVLIGMFLWYRHSLIDLGRQDVRQSVARAIAQEQARADQNAEIYQAQQQKTRIEYRTRVREVIKHVPVNHACDLPDSTVRMLNDAINGRPSAGQPGGSLRPAASAN